MTVIKSKNLRLTSVLFILNAEFRFDLHSYAASIVRMSWQRTFEQCEGLTLGWRLLLQRNWWCLLYFVSINRENVVILQTLSKFKNLSAILFVAFPSFWDQHNAKKTWSSLSVWRVTISAARERLGQKSYFPEEYFIRGLLLSYLWFFISHRSTVNQVHWL